jgi:phosphatidylserine/phosphatidylglycerophosphate/cardiolipin synthase-like enzyme
MTRSRLQDRIRHPGFDKPGQQGDTVRNAVDEYMLIVGMSATTHGTQSVQRWNSECPGEIAV